jgi:hypothetical protein
MPVILQTQEAEIRDQRDLSLKQTWENSSQDLISKVPNTHKKGLVEWLKV